MLALDLGVFHKKTHSVSVKEAAIWSAVWVAISLLFALGMAIFSTGESAVLFLTGYVIEKSLSVDNIFVFVIIFKALRIPDLYQHRVLFWGVLGAIILRAVMILAGTALLANFHWLIYVFGGFLVYTGIKLFVDFMKGEDEGAAQDSWMIRKVKALIRTSKELDGQKFFTIENGKRLATPLFLTLILVELSDVVFAVDSIPAIFAVTLDPFIVFTSNIFAILGLRSLYFLVGPMVDKFHYLKVGLAVVLAYVGLKMILADAFKIPPAISLLIIVAILGVSIWWSMRAVRRAEKAAAKAGEPGGNAG
ncbi:MAG: TerC family protein [Deltaproteobacteria bacterium]|nr:TerC family protein [Deltaproteobacteria bacterium]